MNINGLCCRGIPFTEVKISDRFFMPKLKKLQSVTIRACLDKCWETGRISNFQKAAGLLEGEFEGTFYDDSDVYKLLEGIAYSLMNAPDPELEKEADTIIGYIAAAQEADGYIQTYFTLSKPAEKWQDMTMHEDYCIGHLLEAGIAYWQATGKDTLLTVGKRAADLMVSLFGDKKRHWVPGHQEIELALIKLYYMTDNSEYLDLAVFFLEERGHNFGKGYSWDKDEWGALYCQDHQPVAAMRDAKGHAVRALFMYAAMTDVISLRKIPDYWPAIEGLWDSVVQRNMYITGGVGSSKDNEGFTEDYDLPNIEAYCETCAAVAMVFWNHRLFELTGQAKYADIVERELYNGILSGLSLDGAKFFYVNPLASTGEHHRSSWYTCSCCPTQLSRFLPAIGNYIWALDEKGLILNQFISSKGNFAFKGQEASFEISGHYPWESSFQINVSAVGIPFILRLRVPDWCKDFSLYKDGTSIGVTVNSSGYLEIPCDGEELSLEYCLEMPIRVTKSHPLVLGNKGKVAFVRGPIVYAFEAIDNPNWETLHYQKDMTEAIEKDQILEEEVLSLVLTHNSSSYRGIPYYAWDNRQPGAMAVWIEEKTES